MGENLQLKQEELKHLQLLQELINSELWEALKKEIGLFYETADSMLHAAISSNREYYAGKCRGYRDIIELEENIDRLVTTQEKEINPLDINKIFDESKRKTY